MDELEAKNQRLPLGRLRNVNELAAANTEKTKVAETSKRDYSDIVCFTCEEKGHTSVVCRKVCKTVSMLKIANVQTPPDEWTCYLCGQVITCWETTLCNRLKWRKLARKLIKPAHVKHLVVTLRRLDLKSKSMVDVMLMLMSIFITRLNSRRSRSADIYYGQSKLRWYRCVLNCDRNEPTMEAARIVAGRLFQTLGAAIEKRWDAVLVLECGSTVCLETTSEDSALVYTARAAMISKSALQVCSI